MLPEELKNHYANDPRIQSIAGRIKRNQLTDLESGGNRITYHLKGSPGSFSSLLMGMIYNLNHTPQLIIANTKEDAAYIHNDISHILDKTEPLILVDSFKKPGAYTEQLNSQVQLRTEVLNRIANNPVKNDIVVTYPEALIEKVISVDFIKKSSINIVLHEQLDEDFIIDTFNQYGFERNDFVYEPGQYAIRGGIIDIFSFGSEKPFRVELFGSTIESIRQFDPVSQLSEKKLSKITIVPNMQTQSEEADKISLFDFLPKDCIVCIQDYQVLSDVMERCMERAVDIFDQYSKANLLDDNLIITKSPEQWLCSMDDVLKGIVNRHVLEYDKHHLQADEIIQFDIRPQPSFNKNFTLLIEDTKNLIAKGYTVFIFSDNKKQIERIYTIFDDLKAGVSFIPVYFALREGFIDDLSKKVCYTDHQIFNRYHHYHLRQGYTKSKMLSVKLLQELRPGDYVTHIDHGVGVFSGLEKIEVNGQIQEAVRLIYRDNDLLYVNIQSLHKISKYVGKEGTDPRVNKLGTDTWESVKRRTKAKVKDIANDLIKLYAIRKSQKGYAFQPDSYLQTELEASFIYEDTPDQLKSTQDVKRDMERSYPMDRLICGDVGFGKTEVAIRAAFKAVADSKQVAVLVPTTILALQHYNTFNERLKDFPCKVDYINRFKTSAQQKETLSKLEEGKIDILIGTNSIISSRVKFKNLGLLIIDEEQKFGVASKEKIRQLKANVDTLTLTATPIPRTLQFSLLGARDLSIINTPPPNRQPIETEIIAFDTERIKEIIEHEVYRGGQVFFVHNKVKDITSIANTLKEICSGIDIAVAHGQMEGSLLEEKLLGFIDRRFDVLVSTNIVETGLDIPNANTIIINDAHMFGLSDLHQLRGRVGRSNKKAFCYLITPPMSSLSTDSKRRLKTIEEFSELGSGFQVAMRDLDIRGAGNLLGAEQSGFIADIGYDAYHKILDEAVQELKHTEYKELFAEDHVKRDFSRDCAIETDISMLIPDYYVENINERLSLYTELDNIKDINQIESFKQKLEDRFGSIPQQVHELFTGVQLRRLARTVGFEKISLRQQVLRCYTIDNPESDYYESETFQKIINYVSNNPMRCSLKQMEKNVMITVKGVSDMLTAIQIIESIVRD
jgi:transcription-repair coupling factor (superfamily II helicase)